MVPRSHTPHPHIPLVCTVVQVEQYPDLLALQQEYARQQTLVLKAEKIKTLEQEELDRQKRKEEADLKSYTSVFEGATMLSNTAVNGSATDKAAKDFEDDFM